MKRLFLILLLTLTIPSIHSTGQEKSKKELANEEKERIKAKKDAIKNLKNLLILTYRNWYWSGDIYYDKIDESTSINLISGDYFFLTLILLLEKKSDVGVGLALTLPESYLPNYEGEKNGPKTLKIEGRFEGGKKFETVLHSDNDPYEWFFTSAEIKNVNGETSDIIKDLFTYKKLHIQFQTNQRSRYQGEYKIISFDITGAKEACDAAEAILLI